MLLIIAKSKAQNIAKWLLIISQTSEAHILSKAHLLTKAQIEKFSVM